MPLGRATVVKSNYRQAFVEKRKRVINAYEAARNTAEQSFEANTPRLTGALLASSKATRLPDRPGFVMRSFGNDNTGESYARPVNFGHAVNLKGGGVRFVAANPYFSQAVVDARIKLVEQLRRI